MYGMNEVERGKSFTVYDPIAVKFTDFSIPKQKPIIFKVNVKGKHVRAEIVVSLLILSLSFTVTC